MVRFVSNIETDLESVGLNAFVEFEVSRKFQNNANLKLLGKTFADALSINADGGEGIVRLTMYGPNLKHDAATKILSGKVSGFQQLDTTTGDFWKIIGLDVDASFFMTAPKTPGTADDFALIKRMFAGSDTFSLSNFEDNWHGYKGNDRINGKGDNDHLFGDSGNDTLIGGSGFDTLSGGTGADKYQYMKADQIGDIITRFGVGDKFVFEGKAFGLGNYSGRLKATNFDDVADDANDFFLYDAANDILSYDADGNGTVFTSVVIADITGNATVTASDILII